MKNACRVFSLPVVLAAAALTISVSAQTATAAYDPEKTFAPLTLPDPVNQYRSSNGAPGPSYWQNVADYEIRATLDTANKQLSADEVITYTNNSPDALPSLWLQLEQNIYRKDARAGGMGRRAQHEFTEGFLFDAVEVDDKSHTSKLEYVVSDTRMQLRLPQPLASHGQLRIHIRYHYTIPAVFGGRTSWGMSKKGEIYDIAQWYPRLAVYDDLHGWDTQPYIGKRVLPGVWALRLLRHGAFEHDPGGVG